MNLRTLATYATYGGLAFAGSSLALYHLMTRQVNRWNAPVYEPPYTTIVAPSYNEEFWIGKALESLEKQNVRVAYPEKFELIVVDSGSEDRTVEIARQYTNLVLESPPGKLTARHIGIEHAKGDVIIAIDVDSQYGSNWLNRMLRHFQDPRVVAVSGSEIMTGGWIWTLQSIWFSVYFLFNPRLMGRGSAFRKDAYYEIGGFNLDIDQTNVWKMVWEEEINFRRRLQQVGKYVYDFCAPVYTTARRLRPVSERLMEKFDQELKKTYAYQREIGRKRF